MRQVWLDYVRKPPGHGWPGWALLGLGTVAAASLLVLKVDLDDRIEIADQKISRLQRWVASSMPSARTEKRSDGTDSQSAGENWKVWDQRLTDFETSANEDVTLLALLQDKSSIVINGEAKTLAAAMDYARQLQNAGSVEKVRLTEHSIAKDHPQRPVRFILTARWSGRDLREP